MKSAPYHYSSLSSKRNSFGVYLNYTLDNDGSFMYFIKNEMIVSRNLQLDYEKPTFITKLLRNRMTGLTIWSDFQRQAEWKNRERYICVVQGTESFRLVSPIYK